MGNWKLPKRAPHRSRVKFCASKPTQAQQGSCSAQSVRRISQRLAMPLVSLSSAARFVCQKGHCASSVSTK